MLRLEKATKNSIHKCTEWCTECKMKRVKLVKMDFEEYYTTKQNIVRVLFCDVSLASAKYF